MKHFHLLPQRLHYPLAPVLTPGEFPSVLPCRVGKALNQCRVPRIAAFRWTTAVSRKRGKTQRVLNEKCF